MVRLPLGIPLERMEACRACLSLPSRPRPRLELEAAAVRRYRPYRTLNHIAPCAAHRRFPAYRQSLTPPHEVLRPDHSLSPNRDMFRPFLRRHRRVPLIHLPPQARSLLGHLGSNSRGGAIWPKNPSRRTLSCRELDLALAHKEKDLGDYLSPLALLRKARQRGGRMRRRLWGRRCGRGIHRVTGMETLMGKEGLKMLRRDIVGERIV